MSFNGEQFENFKSKNPITVWKTKQKKHKTSTTKTDYEPCSQGEINWSKIE